MTMDMPIKVRENLDVEAPLDYWNSSLNNNSIKSLHISMGDLQDPKMEVLYHIFGHIF